jgi:peptidoglycan biosynthesis protein MviN/MurJ (putative lipid II flippase)
MMGLALGVAAAAWIAAPMIVQVLFQRGAFSVEDTTLVAAYLKLGLLQMPAFFGGIVLVQWLLASGRYKSVVLASFAALVTKLLLNFALVKEFGGTGIMLATAGMYTVNFLVLLFFVRSDGPQAGRLAAIG